MSSDWDPAKRLSNFAKHGVDFASVEMFEWEESIVTASPGAGEPRLVAVGPIATRPHVLVHGVETVTVRVVSLRLASRREIKRYEEV